MVANRSKSLPYTTNHKTYPQSRKFNTENITLPENAEVPVVNKAHLTRTLIYWCPSGKQWKANEGRVWGFELLVVKIFFKNQFSQKAHYEEFERNENNERVFLCKHAEQQKRLQFQWEWQTPNGRQSEVTSNHWPLNSMLLQHYSQERSWTTWMSVNYEAIPCFCIHGWLHQWILT